MSALEIAGLSVPIGAQIVLRDISLAVPEGGIVCVLGANGAGKTTLMRTISGIYRNATGSIRFGGQDILNRPDARHRRASASRRRPRAGTSSAR